MGYVISLFDCAGEFGSTTVKNFGVCLMVVKKFTAKYPHKIIQVTNLQFCDYDTDGLTPGERDAVELAMGGAV